MTCLTYNYTDYTFSTIPPPPPLPPGSYPRKGLHDHQNLQSQCIMSAIKRIIQHCMGPLNGGEGKMHRKRWFCNRWVWGVSTVNSQVHNFVGIYWTYRDTLFFFRTACKVPAKTIDALCRLHSVKSFLAFCYDPPPPPPCWARFSALADSGMDLWFGQNWQKMCTPCSNEQVHTRMQIRWLHRDPSGIIINHLIPTERLTRHE